MCALPDDWEKGYILEIDVEYPEEFHDNHSDVPLAPENLEISRGMYSPLQQAKFPVDPPQKKLAPNLRNKNNYIVHYRNLKMYVKLGMKITRIHLKPYIDFNTK